MPKIPFNGFFRWRCGAIWRYMARVSRTVPVNKGGQPGDLFSLPRKGFSSLANRNVLFAKIDALLGKEGDFLTKL